MPFNEYFFSRLQSIKHCLLVWKTWIMVLSKIIFLTFFVFFTNVKSNQLTILNLGENFDTLKLLKSIADYNITSICGRHMNQFISDLNSQIFWALQMFDSSAKISSGILDGNHVSYGHFDECLDTKQPEGQFTGKYCMMKVYGSIKANGSEISIYRLILPPEKYSPERDTKRLKFGICVPSSCSTKNIQDGINYMFNETESDEILKVQLHDYDCYEGHKTKNPDWIALGPLVLFGAILVLSTAYDVLQRNTPEKRELLTAFSIYKNGKSLFHISDSSEQLKPLHGMRVISTFWIVLLHELDITLFTEGPINKFGSWEKFHDTQYTVRHVPIYFGYIAVDTFFFLGGVLTCIVFFRDIKKKGQYDIALGSIHRYIRLTPSYAATIFITIYVYPKLGDGPLWNSNNIYPVKTCKEYWWTAILYIQNFVNPLDRCLGQTWYLSTDMQLHLLAPLVLCPLCLWPQFAKYILGITLFISVSINFVIGFTKNLVAHSLATQDFTDQCRIDYVQFYMRAAPYVIGLATGYLIFKIKAKAISIKLKKFKVLTGWLASTILCLGTMYGSIPFNQHENNFGTLLHVLYLCLHRVAWGLGLAWITFACLNGSGGPVNTFLSWNCFQPLSKLSYNVYLIHAAVTRYSIDTSRTNTHIGDIEIVYSFFSCLAISYLLAVPFTLAFEMPFGNIDRHLFKNIKLTPFPRTKKEGKIESIEFLPQTGEKKQDETT